MESSHSIFEKIKAERDVHSDLRAQLLLAKGEVEKAEKLRQKVSYDALTGKDPKAKKQLESAEQVLAGSAQRFQSIESAIAESEKRQADLQLLHDEAVKEERWIGNVADPMKKELANAAEIEKHFYGTEKAVKPFAALIREHTKAIARIRAQVVWFNIPNSLGAIFRRWFDLQLNDVLGLSDKLFWNTQTREKYAGHYLPLLQEEWDRVSAARGAQRPKSQKASNE